MTTSWISPTRPASGRHSDAATAHLLSVDPIALTINQHHSRNIDSVAGPNGVTTARSFDPVGRMVGITYETPFLSWPVGLGRGLGGELTSVTEWGSNRGWAYDGSARVASATNPTGVFSYDPASNPTRLTGRRQAFSGSGELCWAAGVVGSCEAPPVGATLLGYGDNGQRTSVGSDLFGYDATGAMVSASQGDSSYLYSGDGLRVAKTSGGVTTDFTWDDTTSVPQLIADGDNYYLYGPDGLPVERIGADPTVWLAIDGTGSVTASTDVNGALVASRSYDTWGNETGRTGDPVSLGWQSQYQDSETGLYYLWHRYYDPETAQFTTPDPLEDIAGSRYGYADNDPVNGSDPTGLCGPMSAGESGPYLPCDQLPEQQYERWAGVVQHDATFGGRFPRTSVVRVTILNLMLEPAVFTIDPGSNTTINGSQNSLTHTVGALRIVSFNVSVSLVGKKNRYGCVVDPFGFSVSQHASVGNIISALLGGSGIGEDYSGSSELGGAR